MSKIALSPDASGTGTFTLASPNSNTNRTLTLPDAAGELLTTTGDGSALTNLTSANLTGALPAIDGSALTGVAGTPAGAVIYHAANVPPTGFIKANGASLSTTTYADLFAVIGYTFGGSGSSFSVPDLRGEFMRGWDDSRGIDSGRSFGSAQDHALEEHRHILYTGRNWTSSYHTVGSVSGHVGNGYSASYNAGDSWIRDISQGNSAAETRPRNIALLACIKY
jgi:microcystin-dependent protein